MSKEITTTGDNAFDLIQRKAKALASSDLVPREYQNNVANCMIALEVAQRTNSSPLAVAQNLNIIHGKPAWSSSFIIAALNACGRFSPLRFRIDGETCVAYAIDRESGEVIEGPPASIEMAKAEGWYNKSGSKWKTMPDLMLRYRAAAFFGRLYAPDILMGMHTADEVQDIKPKAPSAVQSLNESIKDDPIIEDPIIEDAIIIEPTGDEDAPF